MVRLLIPEWSLREDSPERKIQEGDRVPDPLPCLGLALELLPRKSGSSKGGV
jgi:hypothetical protein